MELKLFISILLLKSSAKVRCTARWENFEVTCLHRPPVSHITNQTQRHTLGYSTGSYCLFTVPFKEHGIFTSLCNLLCHISIRTGPCHRLLSLVDLYDTRRLCTAARRWIHEAKRRLVSQTSNPASENHLKVHQEWKNRKVWSWILNSYSYSSHSRRSVE